MIKLPGSVPGSPTLLPGFVGHSLPKPRSSSARLLSTVGVAALVFVLVQRPVYLASPTLAVSQLTRTVVELRQGSCVERDLVSTERRPWDKAPRGGRTLAVRVKAVNVDGSGEATTIPDGVALAQPFHPTLSALREQAGLFDPTKQPITLPAKDKSEPWGCMRPQEHVVEHLAPAPLQPGAADPVLFHAMCTTPERTTTFAPIWHHFLGDEARGTSYSPAGCLVVDATSGSGTPKAYAKANKALQRARTTCEFRDTSLAKEERYEHRVLYLVKDVWDLTEKRRQEEGGPLVEWFVFGDDDTWWVDQRALKERLMLLDHRDDHFLASVSETANNIRMFGKIAFGGAGMIFSRGLIEKLQPHVATCLDKFGELFGGDAMITNCVAMVKGVAMEDAYEQTQGMQQMDMKGDATGFLTGGLGPFITLHHWAGWLELMPGRVQTDVVELFRQSVVAVGGHNFLRRWVFDEGAVTWTLGYAVVVYRKPLTKEALDQVERTWEDHIPTRPSRGPLVDGRDKLTYYLTSVEPLSPTSTLFRHRCSHPDTSQSVSEIVVVWESSPDNAEEPWWRMGADGPDAARLTEQARQV